MALVSLSSPAGIIAASLVFSPLVLVLGIALFLYSGFCFYGRTPSKVPWVTDDGLFARFNSVHAAVRDMRGMILHAQEKFLSKGQAYIMPSLQEGNFTILPVTGVNWLANRPLKDVHHLDLTAERFQFNYTINHLAAGDPHLPRIRSQNVKDGYRYHLPYVLDEIEHAFDRVTRGSTNGSLELDILPTLLDIISQASSRWTVGSLICRDEKFRESAKDWVLWTPPLGVLINWTPSPIKPLVAKVIKSILDRKSAYALEVHRNLLQEELAKPSQTRDVSQNSVAQFVAEARISPREKFLLDPVPGDVNALPKFLLSIYLGILHTSPVISTNMLLNILTYNTEYDIISNLRKEISTALQKHNNRLSPEALEDMPHLDSTLRETLRLDGLEGHQLHAPHAQLCHHARGCSSGAGVRVGVSQYTLHRDESVYPDPSRFNPYRFSSGEKPGLKSYDITQNFLTWGFGGHACPGRWFATATIKLLIAHLLLNYDVELVGKRRETLWVGWYTLPRAHRMRLTRREKSG